MKAKTPKVLNSPGKTTTLLARILDKPVIQEIILAESEKVLITRFNRSAAQVKALLGLK